MTSSGWLLSYRGKFCAFNISEFPIVQKGVNSVINTSQYSITIGLNWSRFTYLILDGSDYFIKLVTWYCIGYFLHTLSSSQSTANGVPFTNIDLLGMDKWFHPLLCVDLISGGYVFATLRDAWTPLQWNLSVTTTSLMKFITRDLFSNAF